MSGWSIGVLFGAALAASLYALHRSRSERTRLRQRLDAAAKELERLQLAFAHFAPPQVVERIIAAGVSTSAEKKHVTVLFADIVGFTRLSESLDPELLVRLLNGYFARMSRVITEHRGHVAKFIGDGILALFGAIERNPWQASDAVRAALAMRTALEEYRREVAGDLAEPLRIGIGLHCGPAVAGVIGNSTLMEFTAIGQTVNLASRVEGLTRRVGADILVTEAVRDQLDERFLLRRLEPESVAGIAAPVVTYAVEGYSEASATEEFTAKNAAGRNSAA
jgi:class 3 adenylate cyclase